MPGVMESSFAHTDSVVAVTKGVVRHPPSDGLTGDHNNALVSAAAAPFFWNLRKLPVFVFRRPSNFFVVVSVDLVEPESFGFLVSFFHLDPRLCRIGFVELIDSILLGEEILQSLYLFISFRFLGCVLRLYKIRMGLYFDSLSPNFHTVHL